ncbi:MAG: MFS transporter [Legionellaceae bacterium]|nr:MFS transporter [Legionellaceae bacterium]
MTNNTNTGQENFMLAALICLSSGLFFMYEFHQLSLMNQLNEVLRDEFQVSSLRISRLSNAFSLGNILFLLPAGIILDRYSTKKIILITLFISLIGAFGISQSASFFLTAFFRGLTGIGNAFCLAAGILLVSRWIADTHRALFIGLLVTMAYCGGILSGDPFVYLMDNFGWRNALLIDAIFGTIIWLWLLIIIKDSPDPNYYLNINKSKTSIFSGLKCAASNSQNWLAGTYVALINLPIMVYGAVWGISYLESVYKLNASSASEVISMFFIGAIIGCPLSGWVSDKISRRKPVMYLGCIGSIVVFIPLVLGVALSYANLCCMFFCMGLLCGTQIVGYSIISEINKSDAIAKGTSIATFLVMFLGAAVSGMYGALLDKSIITSHMVGEYSSAAYKNAGIIFPVWAIVALILVFFIKETYCRSVKE